MKKTAVHVMALICLLMAFPLFADKNESITGGRSALKAATVKTARMNARGKVVEISDKAVKIERIIKGRVEVMDFALESQLTGILVNDAVNVEYTLKDGKLMALRVARQTAGRPPAESDKR